MSQKKQKIHNHIPYWWTHATSHPHRLAIQFLLNLSVFLFQSPKITLYLSISLDIQTVVQRFDRFDLCSKWTESPFGLHPYHRNQTSTRIFNRHLYTSMWSYISASNTESIGREEKMEVGATGTARTEAVWEKKGHVESMEAECRRMWMKIWRDGMWKTSHVFS